MIPATVLVVDDEPFYAQVLRGVLGREYTIFEATSAADALAILAITEPDIVLLDVMMPGMGGYELCRRLKANPATADIPVIFITALGDEGAETHGLELGAVDYVTKPFDPHIVRARVRNHVALRQALSALAAQVATDGLTGLASRRRFDHVLETECQRLAHGGGTVLSLLLLDIDHFKLFNDSYGHIAGDDCLRGVGHVVTGAMRRRSDLAARYGGEELACVLPGTDAAAAHATAERIHADIARLAIPHTRSSTALHVTVSIGLVTAVGHDTLTTDQLVQATDTCLYRAKIEGRNRTIVGPSLGRASGLPRALQERS